MCLDETTGMTILLTDEMKAGVPTIGAVSFKVCDGTDAMNPETTKLKVKKISEVKHKSGGGEKGGKGGAGKKGGKKGGPDAAAPGAADGGDGGAAAPAEAPLAPAQEEGKPAPPAPPAQPNKMIEIVEDEIVAGPAPGECHYYKEGTAEVILCTKESEAAGDRVKLISGFLFNNGTTDLCDIKLEPAGVEATAVQSVWPDWVADAAAGKDPFIFGSHQTVDIGMTAGAAAGEQPSIILSSFKVCGGTDELKKDTIAYTVPLDSIQLDLSAAQAAPGKQGKLNKGGKAGPGAAKKNKPKAGAAAPAEGEPVAEEVPTGDAGAGAAVAPGVVAPVDGAAPAAPEAPLAPAVEEPTTKAKKAPSKKQPAAPPAPANGGQKLRRY